MFKKYRCLVCGKYVKWYQKIAYEEKVDTLRDEGGNNLNLYHHIEVTHYKCLTDKQREDLKKQKKSKKKDDDNAANNADYIYSD